MQPVQGFLNNLCYILLSLAIIPQPNQNKCSHFVSEKYVKNVSLHFHFYFYIITT